VPIINYLPDPRDGSDPPSRKYDCCSTTACIPPTAPSGLNLVAAGAFAIDVFWTDNATTEDAYDIRWRDITTGGPLTNSPSVAANSVHSTIVVTGTDGDTIEVSVRASGINCDSAWVTSTVIVSGTN
jgi:hypothetical protein